MSQAQETQPEPSQNSGRKTKPNELNLIWVDLEMTGLDPETDRIIEVALVVTDPDLNILAEGPVYAIHQSDEILNGMDAWNRGTHGRSGLIDRVRASFGVISSSELQVEGYPDSLIRLYEKNPEAREFVLDYKKHINDDGSDENIDISGDMTDGKIPLFIQWDERWGYKTYGDDFLAVTGCGPTALSMVCVGLTGNLNMNPYAVAKMAQADGYYVNGSGSSWDMMTGLADNLGLYANELGLDADTIRSKLRDGHPIICIMGPGDFTTTGHFIVLTGVTSNGDVTINDPNSRKNSDKSWNLEEITSQMKNLWVYSKAQ